MPAIRSNVPVRIGPMFTVHVNVNSAVRSESSGLSNVCASSHPPSKVRQHLSCLVCGRLATEADPFLKGREIDGQIVVFDETDLAALTIDEGLKQAITLTVHPADQVEAQTLPSAAAYYLTHPPKSPDLGGYGVLRSMIANNPDKAYCTSFALKGAPAMYRLTLLDEVITLQKMAWPGDMHERPTVPAEPNDDYIAMGQMLADQLLTDFDASLYADTNREARDQIAASKVANAPALPTATATPVQAPAASLMDALRASVAATAPAPAPKAPRKAAPRKSTTKKAS